MSDLFLIHGLMKVGLVIGVMVLIATWPGRTSATSAVARQAGLLFAGLVGASTVNRFVGTAKGVTGYDLDTDSFTEQSVAMEHINLLDTGEPEADSSWPEYVSRAQEDRWMESDSFEPIVNIDGAMMLGDFDVNGNMYGVTDTHFDSWDSNDASSMFD